MNKELGDAKSSLAFQATQEAIPGAINAGLQIASQLRASLKAIDFSNLPEDTKEVLNSQKQRAIKSLGDMISNSKAAFAHGSGKVEDIKDILETETIESSPVTLDDNHLENFKTVLTMVDLENFKTVLTMVDKAISHFQKFNEAYKKVDEYVRKEESGGNWQDAFYDFKDNSPNNNAVNDIRTLRLELANLRSPTSDNNPKNEKNTLAPLMEQCEDFMLFIIETYNKYLSLYNCYRYPEERRLYEVLVQNCKECYDYYYDQLPKLLPDNGHHAIYDNFKTKGPSEASMLLNYYRAETNNQEAEIVPDHFMITGVYGKNKISTNLFSGRDDRQYILMDSINNFENSDFNFSSFLHIYMNLCQSCTCVMEFGKIKGILYRFEAESTPAMSPEEHLLDIFNNLLNELEELHNGNKDKKISQICTVITDTFLENSRCFLRYLINHKTSANKRNIYQRELELLELRKQGILKPPSTDEKRILESAKKSAKTIFLNYSKATDLEKNNLGRQVRSYKHKLLELIDKRLDVKLTQEECLKGFDKSVKEMQNAVGMSYFGYILRLVFYYIFCQGGKLSQLRNNYNEQKLLSSFQDQVLASQKELDSLYKKQKCEYDKNSLELNNEHNNKAVSQPRKPDKRNVDDFLNRTTKTLCRSTGSKQNEQANNCPNRIRYELADKGPHQIFVSGSPHRRSI